MGSLSWRAGELVAKHEARLNAWPGARQPGRTARDAGHDRAGFL